jgi:hypothetical protein
MNTEKYCQSCSIPLDSKEVLGTEKDGTPSKDYCRYCYQKGRFIKPEMTFRKMQSLIKTRMTEMNIPEGVIDSSVASIPHLKRWNSGILRK